MADNDTTVTLRLEAVNKADAALAQAKKDLDDLQRKYADVNKNIIELEKQKGKAASDAWVIAKRAAGNYWDEIQRVQNHITPLIKQATAAHEKYNAALAKTGSEGAKHLKGIGDELAHHVTRFASVAVAIETVRRGFDEFAKSSRGFERVRVETGATVKDIEGLEHSFENLAAVTGQTMPNLIKEFRNFSDMSGLGFTKAKEVFRELVVAAHAADANIGAMGKSVAAAMTALKVPIDEILGPGGLLATWTKTVPASMQNAFHDAMGNIGPTLRSIGIEGRTAAEQLALHFTDLTQEFGSTAKALSAIDALVKKASDWSTPLGKRVLPDIEKFRGDADGYNKSMEVIFKTIKDMGLLDENMTLAQRSLFMKKYGVTEENIAAAVKYNETLELTKEIVAKTGMSGDEVRRRLTMMAEGPQAKQDELNAKLEVMHNTIGKIYNATGLPDSLNKFLATTLREVEGIVRGLKWLDDYFMKTSPGAPAGQGSRKTGAPTKEGVAASGLPLQPGEAEAKAESDRIVEEEDRKAAEKKAADAKTEAENAEIKSAKDAYDKRKELLNKGRRKGRGFARGGEFNVPGSGASDDQPVEFMATPGERVSISSREDEKAESLQQQQDKADISLRNYLASFRDKDQQVERVAMLDERLGQWNRILDSDTDPDSLGGGRSRRGSTSDDPARSTRTGVSRPARPAPKRTTTKTKVQPPLKTTAPVNPFPNPGFDPSITTQPISPKQNHNDLNRDAYAKKFAGTPLENMYDAVVGSADRNNMPASLVAGIIGLETGWGTSNALKSYNNPAGLMDPSTPGAKGFFTYPTIEAGIENAARAQQQAYMKGGQTLAGMASKDGGGYSPAGAANDVYGTNAGWPKEVGAAQAGLSTGEAEPASVKEAREKQYAERAAEKARGGSPFGRAASIAAVSGTAAPAPASAPAPAGASRDIGVPQRKPGGEAVSGVPVRPASKDEIDKVMSQPGMFDPNRTPTETKEIVPGGAYPDPDAKNRPNYYGGTMRVGDQTFGYGSGAPNLRGSNRGSTPPGQYSVNLTKQYGGPGYSSIGSIATVGTDPAAGGKLDDPKYPGAPRLGVQIHKSSHLDSLYTAGCFGISQEDWPRFKQAILEEDKKAGGKLMITVGKDGAAYIGPRKLAPTVKEVKTRTGVDPRVPTGAASPDSLSKTPPPNLQKGGTDDAAPDAPQGGSSTFDLKKARERALGPDAAQNQQTDSGIKDRPTSRAKEARKVLDELKDDAWERRKAHALDLGDLEKPRGYSEHENAEAPTGYGGGSGLPGAGEIGKKVGEDKKRTYQDKPDFDPKQWGGSQEFRASLEKPIEPVIRPRIQMLGGTSPRWTRHAERQRQVDNSRDQARMAHTDAGMGFM